VVSLFISVWAHARHVLDLRSRRYRHTLFALLMGAGVLATMSLPVEVAPGSQFDLRGAFIGTAAFFGGPIAAVIVAVIASIYRFSIGGAGALWGTVVIALTAVLGTLCYWYGKRHHRSLSLLFVFSLGVAAVAMGPLIVFRSEISLQILQRFGWQMAALNFAATFLSGYVLIRSRQISIERRLLRAAVAQAPDFFYVKDRDGRFVAVNQGVAKINGYSEPSQLIGKTDFDLFPLERAQALFDREQEVMRTGRPVVDHEDQLPNSAGEVRWYSSSKSSLHDGDGNVIGLAGVTHDVTARRDVEAEATRNHNLVNFALTEMSDGLAMFDRDRHLVLCNRRYSEMFPLTGEVRRPGAHIRDILKAVVDTGEQINVPKDDPMGWIDRIANSLGMQGDEEVTFADGRWLQIRTRPTSDGSSLVVVADITAAKKAELALVSMTDQLKQLATTDSLTGLLNRRSLDQVLENDLARTGRDRQPLSVLMIDVDRFKAYNDRYGHQAGDACLKLVANCLREAALRPGDSLARYGGEEFVAILPNADEDGAFLIADRLRRSLRDLALPHEGSEKGIVTVSIGIASYAGTILHRHDDQLLQRADEALYDAKAAGRDRVTGWRGTGEVMSRRMPGTIRRIV
jgi:diguanylate cyclase (GGDEF)-like protein/PAS domain S-box-containing protein